jgi:hypothetical protein
MVWICGRSPARTEEAHPIKSSAARPALPSSVGRQDGGSSRCRGRCSGRSPLAGLKRDEPVAGRDPASECTCLLVLLGGRENPVSAQEQQATLVPEPVGQATVTNTAKRLLARLTRRPLRTTRRGSLH